MKDFARITNLITLNIGQLVLASMLVPFGLIHGCPRRNKRGPAGA